MCVCASVWANRNSNNKLAELLGNHSEKVCVPYKLKKRRGVHFKYFFLKNENLLKQPNFY